jgi:hypothetical protein
MVRSATGPRPVLAAVAGAVVGAVASVALASSGWPGDDTAHAPLPRESAAAASRFLAAWERSRLGTWAVDARFERTTAAGRRLEVDVHMAQRPPDRLVTGLGSVNARRGSRRLACAANEDGVVACREADVLGPYADEVAGDMQVLRTYVNGSGGFYAVREDGACFLLRLRLRVLSPPYGVRARFCFDDATGAPIRSEIEKREATDRTVAVSVRGRVSDADLDPVKWNGGGRG